MKTWLEYSISRDAAFYYACRFFLRQEVERLRIRLQLQAFETGSMPAVTVAYFTIMINVLFIGMLSLLGDSTGMVWPMVSRLLTSFTPVEHYKLRKIVTISSGRRNFVVCSARNCSKGT